MATTGVQTGKPETKTVKIDTNLSGKEYHFVNIDSSDQDVVNLAANQALPLYVLLEGYDGSTNAKYGTIALPGSRIKVKLAEAVDPNKFLTSDANGQAEVADAAGERYGALSLEAGAAGDIIEAIAMIGEVEDSDA